MTGAVTSLFGGPVGLPEPNDACISTLRKFLEMAEDGEVLGVAIVALDKDACARWAVSGKVGGYSILGALDTAKAELMDINRGLE